MLNNRWFLFLTRKFHDYLLKLLSSWIPFLAVLYAYFPCLTTETRNIVNLLISYPQDLKILKTTTRRCFPSTSNLQLFKFGYNRLKELISFQTAMVQYILVNQKHLVRIFYNNWKNCNLETQNIKYADSHWGIKDSPSKKNYFRITIGKLWSEK